MSDIGEDFAKAVAAKDTEAMSALLAADTDGRISHLRVLCSGFRPRN